MRSRAGGLDSNSSPHLVCIAAQMRKMNHDNLNPLVGVCIVSPHVCILTLYAKQGKLHDVLLDKTIDLPSDFVISFATDIAKVFHDKMVVVMRHLYMCIDLIRSRRFKTATNITTRRRQTLA